MSQSTTSVTDVEPPDDPAHPRHGEMPTEAEYLRAWEQAQGEDTSHRP